MVRRQSMPKYHSSTILLGLLLLTACARGNASTPIAPLPPVPAEYRVGAPVTNALEAELAGRQLFERPGQAWVGVPRLVLAEGLAYDQAAARIGLGDGQYDVWPAETRVWLTVFQGQWTVMPMMPPGTAAARISYEGCVALVFTAAEGSFISMGDARC